MDSTNAIVTLPGDQKWFSNFRDLVARSLAVPSPQAGYSALSAKNYSGAARQLIDFMEARGLPYPDKPALEAWRDSMLAEGKSVKTVNAKLSAARKLIQVMIDQTFDLEHRFRMESWKAVKDAREVKVSEADKTEADYGRRFTLDSVEKLMRSFDIGNLKGLRDRALFAVMLGAGLRVSEVANLTMADLFDIVNEQGQRGIRIARGKHGKRRVVVLNGWNSWVIRAVQAYTDAIGLKLLEHPAERVFRGVKVAKRAPRSGATRQAVAYVSAGDSISPRNIESAVQAYTVQYQGQPVHPACHDLRRTYAKISKQSGMSFEALRDNLGHASVVTTERYVGRDIDWSERVPNWTVRIE